MKKILWISDYSYSGYTIVTDTLLKGITGKYEIYLLVINTTCDRKGILDIVNLNRLQIPCDRIYNVQKIYGDITNENMDILTGVTILPDLLDKINPDIVLSINDLQILCRQMKGIRRSRWEGITVAYIPVDAENYRTGFFEKLSDFNHVITMNKRSKKVMINSGFYNHVYVLEHPISTTFYETIGRNMRDVYFGGRIKADDIIIMNSNCNSIRKRLDITLEGFYKYMTTYKTNKKVFLVLKTSKNGFYNFDKLIQNYNMTYNIELNSQIIIVNNKFSYEELNNFYNCADMYISTTSGEGWGLTAFEFLSMNTWTLVPDNISYTDYFDNSLKLKCVQKTIANCRNKIVLEQQNVYTPIMTIQRNTHSNSTVTVQNNIIEQSNNGWERIIVWRDDTIYDLINILKKKDKCIVYLHIDVLDGFRQVDKFMKGYYYVDLATHLKGFNITTKPVGSYDHFITKVNIPTPETVSDGIHYYVSNKEYCDNKIRTLAPTILSGLDSHTIQKNFNTILDDIMGY